VTLSAPSSMQRVDERAEQEKNGRRIVRLHALASCDVWSRPAGCSPTTGREGDCE
jgi:hypothetical protein